MARQKNNFQRWLAYMKKVPPGDVPSQSDAGKVLAVGPDGKLTWASIQGLPEIAEADKNKVLVVDSNGNPTWGNVAGGEIPLGDGETIGIFKE